MRDFLTFLIKNIVDYPDQIIIDQHQDNDKTTFNVQVAKDDVGKVIGKEGHNANALRVLLGAVAAKEGKRAWLEIAD